MTSHEIDCEQALRRIFEFIDHELDGAERDAMERHLSTCRSCFSRADFEKRLKGKMAGIREERASPGTAERIAKLMKGF
jgi:anti-sigma factor (TIGR02949 family)